MFNCFFCKETVEPNTPCHKVVLQRRVKQYPERNSDLKKGIIVQRPLPYVDEKGKKKLRYPADPGGTGWEILREVASCPRCALLRK